MIDEWECESCSEIFKLDTEYDRHIEIAHGDE